jgi:hypothetical protein
MSKKISRIDKYEATPDQIMAMLTDPDYVQGKYPALGDVSFEVVEHTSGEDSLDMKVSRVVPSDLPDFAKKILGQTNNLVQTERWSKTADGYICDLHIETPGKPLNITGKLEVKGTGEATSDWHVNMDIKASIPLVGGKLEGAVAKETLASLDKEYAFNQEWLASH